MLVEMASAAAMLHCPCSRRPELQKLQLQVAPGRDNGYAGPLTSTALFVLWAAGCDAMAVHLVLMGVACTLQVRAPLTRTSGCCINGCSAWVCWPAAHMRQFRRCHAAAAHAPSPFAPHMMSLCALHCAECLASLLPPGPCHRRSPRAGSSLHTLPYFAACLAVSRPAFHQQEPFMGY